MIKPLDTFIRFTIYVLCHFYHGLKTTFSKNNDENLIYKLKLSCLAPFLFHGLDRRQHLLVCDWLVSGWLCSDWLHVETGRGFKPDQLSGNI